MDESNDEAHAFFKSISREELEQLPQPSPDEIREAIERGRKARAKAEAAFRPSKASSSFYK